MFSETVKLVFKSIESGSGLMDVLEKVKALQINMGQLGGACAKAGVAFGTVGALAGSALKSMITGNLWELGATGLRWIIDEYDLLGRKAAAAAEEAKRAWEDALDGIGIPMRDRHRIFERFYRVDKSHSKEVGGTGLGLSIVKHAARLHNAKLEVDSIVGEGTLITVKF